MLDGKNVFLRSPMIKAHLSEKALLLDFDWNAPIIINSRN